MLQLGTCSPMLIDVNGIKYGAEAGSNLSSVVDLMCVATKKRFIGGCLITSEEVNIGCFALKELVKMTEFW